MVIMPMLSGVFVNERGTSSTFISLLTKEDVIQASQQEPYTSYEIKRMIGGSFMDIHQIGLGLALQQDAHGEEHPEQHPTCLRQDRSQMSSEP
jgi:hypothetical protein